MLELLDLNSMVKFNGKKIWEPHEFFQTFLFSKKFFQNTISVSLQRSSADKAYTVKSVLSGHLKIDKTNVLMENGSLMKVKSIVECSKGSILQYF